MINLIIPSIIILSCILVFVIIKKVIEGKLKQRRLERVGFLAEQCDEITVGQFFKMRKEQYLPIKKTSKRNFSGVYLLFNKTKEKYYVGQATCLWDRVNQHFTGKGNGDVYADYKYNNSFTIRMVPLEGSGFDNLNDLERYAIERFNAYTVGYNKTKGNQ